MRIGVQLHPQHCSMSELLDAARAADELGVDTIWTWDHFYPLYDDEGAPKRGAHFEGWTTLTAIACRAQRAEIGLLVGCNSYRNPQLVADMARTLDHVSEGRAILGLGAGWFEKDYLEYGYEFGTAPGRLQALSRDLPLLKERLGKLNPPPLRNPMPLMIGGGGEKVTLRIVARHATMWNGFGPPDNFRHKNRILDEWCSKEGRNPREIERTVLIFPNALDQLDGFAEAGAQHMILGLGWPFPLQPLQDLLKWRESRLARR